MVSVFIASNDYSYGNYFASNRKRKSERAASTAFFCSISFPSKFHFGSSMKNIKKEEKYLATHFQFRVNENEIHSAIKSLIL